MAFKNLLTPNVASATKFMKNVYGFSVYSGSVLSSSNEQARTGNRSLKISTDASLTFQGFIGPQTFVQQNNEYTGSLYTYGATGSLSFQFYEYSSTNSVVQITTKTLNLSPLWNRYYISKQITSPLTAYCRIVLSTGTNKQSLNYFVDSLQFEQGILSDYEFPGIDCTGNSIPSTEHVENLSLESLIKLNSITSSEIVENLIIQNTLQLLNISSMEQVYDINLLNELVLEGIESTEDVHDLLLFVISRVNREYYGVIKREYDLEGLIRKEYDLEGIIKSGV